MDAYTTSLEIAEFHKKGNTGDAVRLLNNYTEHHLIKSLEANTEASKKYNELLISLADYEAEVSRLKDKVNVLSVKCGDISGDDLIVAKQEIAKDYIDTLSKLSFYFESGMNEMAYAKSILDNAQSDLNLPEYEED